MGSRGRSPGRTRAWHWNGVRWTSAPVPALGWAGSAYLRDVSPASNGQLWAVGGGHQRGHGARVVIQRWHRGSWRVMVDGERAGTLHGVTTAAAGRVVWAVDEDDGKPLVLRYEQT